LASYFDIWFALTHLPRPEATLVRAVIDAPPDQLLTRLDILLNALSS
jgi:hypothetical protein